MPSRLLRSLACITLACASALTWAESWPARPVTIVVPYSPGGNTDMMARMIGERLSKTFATAFVIENRAGVAGLIAAKYVAGAKPDGYTLFFGTLTQISTAPFTNKLNYDPIKDFVPVANVGGNPFVVTASASVPAKDLKEFIAWAKSRPAGITMGHAGVGGLTHLSGMVFAKDAGITVVDVPYKGAANALTDVVAGQLDMYSGNLSEVVPYAKDPRVRLLAVSSKHRIKQLPGVPAIGEVVPGSTVVETWNGLLAPRGTPQEVVDKVADAVLAAERDPAFRAQLEDAGITPLMEARQDFARRIQEDMKLWKPIIESAGLNPQ